MRLFLFPLAAAAAWASAAAPAGAAEPHCIVFCAGVEQYGQQALNSTRYVATDTLAVWNRFKEFPDFDASRSRLLIASREANGLPEDVRRGAVWPEDESL